MLHETLWCSRYSYGKREFKDGWQRPASSLAESENYSQVPVFPYHLSTQMKKTLSMSYTASTPPQASLKAV